MTTYAQWLRDNPGGDLAAYELWAKRQREPVTNQAARFLPQAGEDSRPCIEVGGAVVFAYVRDGVLVVSVDVDTASAAVFDVYGADRCVPVRVNVGDSVVFEATS